jgi:HK97 family phage portal protein
MTIKSFFQNIRGKGATGFLTNSLPYDSRKWGGSDFLDALDISIYLSRAIDKRAGAVGETELFVTDLNKNPVKSDIIDLLAKPNPFFTGRQFWALWQTYLDTVGEAYVLVERGRELFAGSKPTALHLLYPLSVKPIIEPTGIVGYEYQPKNGAVIKYSADQVIYVRRPDPKNMLRGVSLLKAGMATIQLASQIDQYQASVLKNGGKVESMFKFKGNLTSDQMKLLKSGYDAEYAGARKSGKPLFLGGDADYMRIGLTPDEMGYLKAKGTTVEDICAMTGVPKSMLAATNEVKFDNADADRAIFLGETVRPLIKTLVTALDEFLLPDNLLLNYVDRTPENSEMKLKETESGVKSGYMSVNEARARHGLEAVPEGEVIMVPFSVMPLKQLGTEVAPEQAKSLSHHPLDDKALRASYGRVQVKRLDRRTTSFKKALDKYLKEQEARILADVQPTKSKSLNSGLDLGLEVAKGKESLLPILQELLIAAGVDAAAMASGRFIVTDIIRSWLEKKADVFLRSVNETTFEQLQRQFEESAALNEGREELIKRIRDTYDDISKGRANTIARTETHGVTQYGTIEGYRQSGLNNKIWVSVMDAATRDMHAALDGEKVPIDRPFSNGLMFPGDPNGPASEVCNCRCQC